MIAGAVTGIALRLAYFAQPGHAFSVMAAGFIYFVPLAVGAITVYVAETKRRRSWAYYFWMSALANVAFVIGTMLILIEGMICAIVIAPLFAMIGGIGGLIMGAVCRMTHWPRHAAYGFSVLPLLLGVLPAQVSEIRHISLLERSTVVRAPAAAIWEQLLNARAIEPEEVGDAWMYRIGVPLPVSGVTQQTSSELVRKITMGKSIHFEQVATEWQENGYVRWTYRFFEDSFPPNALDDHVKIGGRYFDIIDTSYRLIPAGPGSTELRISMRYRVSTQFNWYADSVARLLVGNFEEVILNFYRVRAERAAAGGGT